MKFSPTLHLIILTILSVTSLNAINFSDDFDNFTIGDTWSVFDRGELSHNDGIVSLKNCYIHAGDTTWQDYSMEFRARAPEDAEDVQIFVSFRYQSDKSRYVFGMRGGNNNDLFLVRYGDRNKDAMLKIEPLEFTPKKNVWYKFRIQVEEFGVQVFFNNEEQARLKATDAGAPFNSGKIALGGGWNKVEFDSVKVTPLQGYEIHKDALRYNFQDLSQCTVEGWKAVDTSPYNKDRGYGWNEGGMLVRERNISRNPLNDTLVGFSTLGSKIFLHDLPDGDYVVSVGMGDPEHRSKNRIFFMDELRPSVNVISAPAETTLLRKSITTYNGTLRMRFEVDEPGVGGSFNWMAIETREQAGEDAWFKYLTTKQGVDLAEKEALRKSQREAYTKQTISSPEDGRTVYSLNGNWLFIPDYEVQKSKPWLTNLDDSKWHVMDVPNFWTPHYSWTYNDYGQGRGSRNWVEIEKARCEAYTFDYIKTKTGYYRHTLDLPTNLKGKTVQINFDAIGRESEIWVNGKSVAKHVGMFAPVRADITSLVKPGENIVVVRAGDSWSLKDYNTGDLGKAPIHMMFGRNRGIWQNVTLEISDSLTIDDTFFKPDLNHFDIDVKLSNRGNDAIQYQLAAQIRDHKTNKLVYDHHRFSRISAHTRANSTYDITLVSDDQQHEPFEIWSPENPNLYTAEVFAYNYNKSSSVNIRSFNPNAVKLNFQGKSHASVEGWTPVDGSKYNGSGYGWNEEILTVDRDLTEDQLADTFVMPNPDSEAVFTHDLPNGDYVVTLQFGDPLEATLAEAYVGNAVSHINNAIVRDFKKAGETQVVLQSLIVENGKLEITVPRMPAIAAGTALNYLVIEKRSDVSAEKWNLGMNHFNVLDNLSHNAGFRTVGVAGDSFTLNGSPWKLRGATLAPNILKPNDGELAEWFMSKLHEKNIHMCKNHAAPWTKVWLDAADKNGVGISTEGIWVWLMLEGKGIPELRMRDVWINEWSALLNKHKNHPSILFLTHNNEMKLFLKNKKEKFQIQSDALQIFRDVDPTRPVVVSTAYCRAYLEDKGGLHPGIDDGDIDDSHTFHNWYDRENFFWLRDGVSYTRGKRTPGRPYTSNEFATGYPDADTGHPVKHYIYQHMTAHALVGKWTYEERDPKYWLKMHALMAKESCETIRTEYRDTSAGMMLFALGTWFQNLYDVNTIKPYPTLDAVSMGWEPVMVSAQLGGRQFYAGSTHTVDTVVVNDSPNRETLNDIRVEWEVYYQEKSLSSGTKNYRSSLKYYNNKREELSFTMPTELPEPRINAELRLKLFANGKFQSMNKYDIIVCENSYHTHASHLSIGHYFQENDMKNTLSKLGSDITPIKDLNELNPGDYDVILVSGLETKPDNYDSILKYIEEGGQVIFSDNKDFVKDLFPDEIRGSTLETKEIVTPCAYHNPVFDGLEPDDLKWFTNSRNSKDSIKQGHVPIACERAYNVNDLAHVTRLAETVRIHGYYRKEKDRYDPGSTKTYDDVRAYTLVEIKKGKGRAIISAMYFQTAEDPIAHKLLANILNYLAKEPKIELGQTGRPRYK